jgi:N-acetylated-alpha-linked acidic dipeptidase
MPLVRVTVVLGAVGLAAFATLAALPAPASDDVGAPIFGFSKQTVASQLSVERRIKGHPSTARIQADHRYLTDEPHVAGSPRAARSQTGPLPNGGLDEVEIIEHEVLLPYPEEVRVEMTAPRSWPATLREDPIGADRDTLARNIHLASHAFSASGEVSGPVVYAGSGNPSDYDWLASHGIEVKGAIALIRYSVPCSYRGFKALTAQQRGAAGIIIHSDPADDGYGKER